MTFYEFLSALLKGTFKYILSNSSSIISFIFNLYSPSLKSKKTGKTMEPETSSPNSADTSIDPIVMKMLAEIVKATEKEEIADHQDREYQTFLVELAKKRNIIVCLPTGSGKTFIALLLTKYYLPRAIQEGRKIVFLANTVPLVNQQAEYFRKHLSNQFLHEESHNVECLTGDRQVDYWKPEKWKTVLDNCHVIVMTTQIFVDALGHGYMRFSDVIFMVLDECHHTDKDAPMNKVMEDYRSVLEKNNFKWDREQLPRVLGLTATIINGKGKKVDVRFEVRDAEDRLCARAVTYHKYEEVLKHSTCAKVEFVVYKNGINSSGQSWSPDLLIPLTNFKAVLERNSKVQAFREKLPDIDHDSFKGENQRFASKESDLTAFKKLINEVIRIFSDLGPYCARIAAIHKRAYINCKSGDEVENIHTSYMSRALDTALTLFICQVERFIGQFDEADQIQMFVTDKVAKLLDKLKVYDPAKRLSSSPDSSGDELCGLVFVEHRITAQVLTWFLEDAARTPIFKFLKPGFVVGSATFGLDPKESRITANAQAVVIRKFRAKDHNILVATRVLEEGLDVPACNLVIRFDKVHSYPSYVQSMGRARNKNSKFYGFIEETDQAVQKQQYDYFEKYNLQLSDHLRVNAIHADDEEEDEVRTSKVELAIPNFEPNPGQSPRITALESISIAQRYCQTLPCDKLVKLSPVSWWEKRDSGFQAHVQFPSNSVIREIITGDVQETKTLAKRSAFLKACVKLYEKNVLDERLFPIPRCMDPMLNEFIKTMAMESDADGKKVGTKNRTQRYPKKTPDCLRLTNILPGISCRVYEISVRQLKKTEDEIAQRLYNFKDKKFVYGLVTAVNLDVIPEFILNVNPSIGNLVVSLKEVTLQDRRAGVSLLKEEIQRLKEFQRYLFGDLLELRDDIMRTCDVSSFLIIPMSRAGEHRSIHWDLITRLLTLPPDFNAPPTDERRSHFKFELKNYEDAVIVPWYRTEEPLLYTVLKPWEGHTPMSEFYCNKQYPNFKSYFEQKYKAVKTIQNVDQLLLKAKLIPRNLNFFKTDISYKATKEQRKEQQNSVIELVPELAHLHPIPASLYIQGKMLPSVIQRISRFLNAFEIQRRIASETPWADNTDVGLDYKEELTNLMCKNEPIDTIPEKKFKVASAENSNIVNGTSVKIQRPLATSNFNALELQIEMEKLQLEEVKSPAKTHEKPVEIEEPVLDFIHPRDLSFDQIKRVKDRTTSVANKVRSRTTIEAGDTQHDWKHEKECNIKLLDMKEIEALIDEELDCAFSYEQEKQPSLYTIMQAITMEASLDSVTLERLETIGDSFLKYSVSRHIFSYFPDFDEGKMTQWRSTLISNKYLYSKGKDIGLGEYLAHGIFRPDCAWLPPSFQVPEVLSKAVVEQDVNEDVYYEEDTEKLEKLSPGALSEFVKNKKPNVLNKRPLNVGYTHSRVPDKSLADCAEALIGAYYISGGVGSALHFMDRLGLRGPTSVDRDKAKERVPFGDWPYQAPNYKLDAENPDRVENHIQIEELERVIGYKFKNPWLALEAFSHPCYMKNLVTGCYQRLEFLGDAVLDFLITNHIYKSRVMTPGQLTDLRSALVNNVTFACLSVRYGLYTYFLYNDKKLHEGIDCFVEAQKEVKHEVTGHFTLISDVESHVVTDIECPKVLGDMFESLAGAVFVDSGMSLDITWKVFYRLMKHEIDLFSKNVPKSPVRELYEFYPGRIIFKDIPDEARDAWRLNVGLYYIQLMIPFQEDKGQYKHIVGVGKSKINAKLAAAKYANKLRKQRTAA